MTAYHRSRPCSVPQARRRQWRQSLWSLLGTVILLLALSSAISQSRAQPAEPSPQLKALQEEAARLYNSGAHDQALAAAQRVLAETIREFGPEHEQVGVQTYGLGLVAEGAGRWADAEHSYRQSVRIREKVYGAESAGTAQAVEKLGGAVLHLGRIDEAEVLFRRVLKIRTDILGDQHSFSASAHADLGAVSLARRNFAEALTNYRKAVRLLTAPRPVHTVTRAVGDDEIRRHRGAFAGLAFAAWESGGRQGNGDAPSRPMMEESYAASQQAWSTSAASALARMSARIGAGTSDLGRRIRQLQDMSEKVLALHEEDMQALAARSARQRADSEYAAALAAFRQASIDRGRDNAPVVKRQSALVEQLQGLFRRCPPGQKAGGCEGSEREREAITRELGTLSAKTAVGSADLNALNQRLQAADARVSGYAQFEAERKARLDGSQRLDQEIVKARAAVVAAFPDYVALTEPKPLSIAETQALLRPDEALVTILVGPSRGFVWAIARERAAWAPIEAGSAALVEHVTALRRGLDQPETDQPATAGNVLENYDLGRAHALYKLVLQPIAHVLAGKQHVIVVPTGPLSSLPFQVLLTDEHSAGADAAQALRSAPWLIRRHALSTLPSVQSLAALRRLAPTAVPAKPFLGIGDPEFGGAQPSPAQSGQTARGRSTPPKLATLYRNGQADLRALRGLARLPESAYELQTIARLLGATSDALLLRAQASESRVKQTRLEDYRVVHFATHGIVAGELSGLNEPALVLTPPDVLSDLDDGLLTASEIASLRLSAEWVVLSACNTASGAESGAEALSGLARAFFHAGARGLLVSHWAVDSQAAVELTTKTFARLTAEPGLGRAEAFRRTMLGMIEAGHPPANWAPFIIVGEGATGSGGPAPR